MELFKFIMWLTAGAIIGWFASRMVAAEHRWNHKLNRFDKSIGEII